MTDDLSKKSVAELLEKFTAIALAQDQAERRNEFAKYNRLYKQMEVVIRELKERPDDARHHLSRYFSHPNPQVRLKAAISCLVLMPMEARRVLQALFDGNWFPQAAEAKGILMSMDAGRYVPD